MAKIRALRVEKLTFILPDTFSGTEEDALLLAAKYMLEKKKAALQTPTDPRANVKRATVEVLEGGGRLAAVMSLHTLDVPVNVPSEKQSSLHRSIVTPSLVVPR